MLRMGRTGFELTGIFSAGEGLGSLAADGDEVATLLDCVTLAGGSTRKAPVSSFFIRVMRVALFPELCPMNFCWFRFQPNTNV